MFNFNNKKRLGKTATFTLRCLTKLQYAVLVQIKCFQQSLTEKKETSSEIRNSPVNPES